MTEEVFYSMKVTVPVYPTQNRYQKPIQIEVESIITRSEYLSFSDAEKLLADEKLAEQNAMKAKIQLDALEHVFGEQLKVGTEEAQKPTEPAPERPTPPWPEQARQGPREEEREIVYASDKQMDYIQKLCRNDMKKMTYVMDYFEKQGVDFAKGKLSKFQAHKLIEDLKAWRE